MSEAEDRNERIDTIALGMIPPIRKGYESAETGKILDGLHYWRDGDTFRAANTGKEPVPLHPYALLEPRGCVRWQVPNGEIEAFGLSVDDAEDAPRIEPTGRRVCGLPTFHLVGENGRLKAEDVLAAMLLWRFGDEYRKELRKRESRPRRTKGSRALPRSIKAANDPLTHALASGPKSAKILPQDYFTERAVKVKTSSKGYTSIAVKTDFEDMEAVYSAYGIQDRERYWLDAVYSFAAEGVREFKGSDMLRLLGYRNPQRRDGADAMDEAASALIKCKKTVVTIDATEERRKRDGRIVSAIRVKSILDGVTIDLETLRDEESEKAVKDFTVTLPATRGKFDALPLAAYADERGMLLTISPDMHTFFKTKPSKETRRAWQYIVRRIEAHGMGNKVMMARLFDDLALPPVEVCESVMRKDAESGDMVEVRKRTQREIERERVKREQKRRRRIEEGLMAILDEMSGGRRTVNPKTGRNEYEYPRRIAGYEIEREEGRGRGIASITVKPLKRK